MLTASAVRYQACVALPAPIMAATRLTALIRIVLLVVLTTCDYVVPCITLPTVQKAVTRIYAQLGVSV